MIPRKVLDIMECPSCGHPDLGIGTRRQPDLVCEGCGERYPFVGGVPDMVPRKKIQQYQYYRTDTLLNLIAPFYDVAAPLMSLAVWQCSPLRYVDMAHKAVGRSAGGAYLECPIGTGLVLGHIQAEHIEGPLIGVDSSWKMLRRAQARFEENGMAERVTLLRADPERLPFRGGAFRSLQSVNGLHAFHDRMKVLTEFDRVMEAGGLVSGSVLVRGQNALADAIMNTYERYGVFPMLRSREFIISELRRILKYEVVRHETYGSVLFFSAQKAGVAAAAAEAAAEVG